MERLGPGDNDLPHVESVNPNIEITEKPPGEIYFDELLGRPAEKLLVVPEKNNIAHNHPYG